MKAFIATSLRHRDEAFRVIDILNRFSIEHICCITEQGTLEGRELFEHNYDSIASSDLFIAILKELGKDVSTEIGLAYALGKTRFGVLYDLNPSDVMPYFAAGHLVNENGLEDAIRGQFLPERQRVELFDINFLRYAPNVNQGIIEIFQNRKLVEGCNVRMLEETLSRRYNREVIATSSGTAGIMVVLDAVLKDNAKEVVLPAMTFPATVQAVLHAGGIPVFADVSGTNWNLDPDDVKRRITRNTGAIIPVNSFGVPCDIERFHELGKSYHIPIIYDSCQAFGASTTNGEVGTFGDAEVFSLDATKLVSGGLGGFISVSSDALAKKTRIIKNFGKNNPDDPLYRGFNARMLEFSALLALHHLADFESNVSIARKNLLLYHEAFKGIPFLRLQDYGDDLPSPHLFAVFLDHPNQRIAFEVRDELENLGVGSRVYNPTQLHNQILFGGYTPGLMNTEGMQYKLLCLPVHEGVREEHIAKIARALYRRLT